MYLDVRRVYDRSEELLRVIRESYNKDAQSGWLPGKVEFGVELAWHLFISASSALSDP